MSGLFTLFLNNLLPVFIIAGIGYIASRMLRLEAQSLSQVIFYVFSPCLIFNLLTQNELNGSEVLRMMALAAVGILLVGLITFLVGKVLRFDRCTLSSVMLASMFMNAGNYGLPVVLFAFGEVSLSFASLFFVSNALLAYTLGVVVASTGSASLRQAFVNLFKIPTLYALLLALIFMRTGWEVPLPLQRSVQLLGDASVPSMLVLLGLQLRNARWNGHIFPLAVVGGMRLLVSPLITFLFASSFGIQGPALQAGVLESGMPSAILATVLATQYDADTSLVTSAVMLTTLLSPFTLTPLLALLGA